MQLTGNDSEQTDGIIECRKNCCKVMLQCVYDLAGLTSDVSESITQICMPDLHFQHVSCSPSQTLDREGG